MKLPQGTTQEQWDEYEKAMLEWHSSWKTKEPMPWDYSSKEQYNNAYAQWDFQREMFRPNKPGYTIANND